jgi:hypothetical protein
LSSVLVAANAIVMGQPETYLSWKPEQFDMRIGSSARARGLLWFIEPVSGRAVDAEASNATACRK